jgi:hypothetical protein
MRCLDPEPFMRRQHGRHYEADLPRNGRLWDSSLLLTAAMHFRRLVDPKMASHKEHLILDMMYALWDDREAIADEKDIS